MSVVSERARHLASGAFDALVAAPFVVLLHVRGLAGDAPLWLLLLTLVLAQASTDEGVQRRLGGLDLARHTHPRLAAQVGLGTAFIYLLGWGPVLASALVLVLVRHLTWGVDADIWRPMFGWSVVAIACGQAAIAIGLVPTYVPSPGAHALAGLTVVLLFLIMRLLGLTSAERFQAEQAVRLSEQRFRALVQNSTDVVLITDAFAVPSYVSPSSERVTGRPADELLGVDPYSLVHPDDHQAMDAVLATARMHPGAEARLELRTLHADGTWHWLEAVVRNLLDEPAVGGLVVNYRDTTERRALEDQLRHQAFHDPMTGLANRALFMDRLGQALARQRPDGPGPVVMLIDVDDFKAINDSLGHPAGDALLVDVAASLSACVPPGDTVSRLGGDEFAVLLESVSGQDQVQAWAARVLAAVQRDFDLAGRRLPVTASIGVAASATTGGQPDALLRDADVAMYVAKADGKGSYAVYRAGMAQAVHSRLQLKTDLIEAVEAGDQMELVYQPVLDLGSGRACGVEALLRWNHPTRGVLVPADFLQVAEETGLIVPLGRWVVGEACAQLARWRTSAGAFADLWMSVNVSLSQLADPLLLQHLEETLQATGLDPSRLVLEVHETCLVHDAPQLGDDLQAIRAKGIRVGVDDFGASSTSLAFLRDFPIDLLKIDEGFVTDADDSNAVIIADAIVELAGRLSVPVVAQGIGSLTGAAKFRAISCDYGQGTLFAPPADPQTVATLVGRLNDAVAVPVPRKPSKAAPGVRVPT